ncbi:MAG: TonB-dependent receptor, partial [Acidobacteriales bacterium]|nr:TonB-dependent receptor [Terriglobales bacterium]
APALSVARRSVQVATDAIATLDFVLRIALVTEQIIVTATGREETAFESFQATTTLDAIQLTERAHTSIGEVLQNEPGIAKRSFGPGSTRPVLRGFDGDRVLMLMDGLNTGALSSQSGDHGENLNVLNLERVEVVRGPATLLYGSNAIGGVVNAITGQHQTHEHPHPGPSGYLTGVGGSTNDLGGGSGGLDFGFKEWVFRVGGGGQRTADYETPIGTIPNSRSRNYDARGGLGWYGDKAFASGSYDYDNRRYGIPFAAFLESGGTATPDEEVVNLRLRRHDAKLTAGFHDLDSAITGMRVNIGYTNYRHGEFDGDELGTDFRNKLFSYRVTFTQQKAGPLNGSFGVSGAHRDYQSIGDEALAPPTTQNSFAVFALQTIGEEKYSVQLGGRFEHNGYDPSAFAGILVPNRTFNGFSGAAGLRLPLWKGGAFITNYTHSFRSPALEELYNNGPHPGNLAFEIGNPNLRREQANGIDVALRQQAARFRAEANFFYYVLSDFVFLSPTGLIEDGLFQAEYLQGDSRYTGGEITAEIGLLDNFWLNAGFDLVNAELTGGVLSPTTSVNTPAGTSLPRIPPMRWRVGLDYRYKGFSVRPEALFAAAQEDLFTNETRTAGYTVFDVGASYTIARSHMVHVFSVNGFNLGNRLYRNHLSFIKDLAPEIGRGLRFAYTVRFY